VEAASVVPVSNPPEEATTRSTVDLADMLEPPSETSLALRIDSAELEEPLPEARDTEAPSGRIPRAWMFAGAALLGTLGIAVFAIVASGVLEPAPSSTSQVTDTTHVARPVTTGTTSPTAGTSTTATGPSGAATSPAIAIETSEGEARAESDETAPEGGEDERGESERPARAGRGSVNVAARGGWADLFVDGRPAGRTPRSVPLPAGRHLLELRPPGGAPIRRFVNVRAGRTQRVVIDL
jgi:hypothetical protein